ncbi:zinc finger BED domain-containing protein RICESLEEPER 2-like protein [Tanacetum coccineum]
MDNSKRIDDSTEKYSLFAVNYNDMESSPVEGSSSQGLGQNSTASPFAATRTPNDNPTLEDNEINRTTNNRNMEEEEEEESSHFESKKRKTTSKVWDEFTKIKLPDGRQKAECHHCKSRLSVLASGNSMSQVVTPALVDGSVTTDMWKSTNQKIEYMVLTGHFVDSNWRLQKRVLSFIHLPPPHRGTDIADNLYKCFKDWNIENKVFTISVDNASNNDKAIKNLTETFSRIKKLPCGGKLFHVRCGGEQIL